MLKFAVKIRIKCNNLQVEFNEILCIDFIEIFIKILTEIIYKFISIYNSITFMNWVFKEKIICIISKLKWHICIVLMY